MMLVSDECSTAKLICSECSNIYYAMLNRGPVACAFNYIICVLGALSHAARFAELSSIIPIAGALGIEKSTGPSKLSQMLYKLCNIQFGPRTLTQP